MNRFVEKRREYMEPCERFMWNHLLSWRNRHHGGPGHTYTSPRSIYNPHGWRRLLAYEWRP